MSREARAAPVLCLLCYGRIGADVELRWRSPSLLPPAHCPPLFLSALTGGKLAGGPGASPSAESPLRGREGSVAVRYSLRVAPPGSRRAGGRRVRLVRSSGACVARNAVHSPVITSLLGQVLGRAKRLWTQTHTQPHLRDIFDVFQPKAGVSTY